MLKLQILIPLGVLDNPRVMFSEYLNHQSWRLASGVNRRAFHKDHVDSFFHQSIYFLSHRKKDFSQRNEVTDPSALDIVLKEIEAAYKFATDKDLGEGIPAGMLFKYLSEIRISHHIEWWVPDHKLIE